MNSRTGTWVSQVTVSCPGWICSSTWYCSKLIRTMSHGLPSLLSYTCLDNLRRHRKIPFQHPKHKTKGCDQCLDFLLYFFGLTSLDSAPPQLFQTKVLPGILRGQRHVILQRDDTKFLTLELYHWGLLSHTLNFKTSVISRKVLRKTSTSFPCYFCAEGK